MIYNLLTQIKDYDGSFIENDLTTIASEKGKPLNYKQVIITVLKTPSQSNPYSPDQLVMADSILRRVYEGTPEKIELSADEVNLILTRSKFIFLTPRVPSEADKFFNQKETPKE